MFFRRSVLYAFLMSLSLGLQATGTEAACSVIESANYPVPLGSTYPVSVAVSPSGSYLATANGSSNDVTIFTVGSGGALSKAATYLLPSGSTGVQSVAFSPNGSYLATANGSSSDVTIFTVGSGGALSNATSYALPSGSTDSTSVAF